MANQEFVRAVKQVMEELQAAGLIMNSDIYSLVWCLQGNGDVVFSFSPHLYKLVSIYVFAILLSALSLRAVPDSS